MKKTFSAQLRAERRAKKAMKILNIFGNFIGVLVAIFLLWVLAVVWFSIDDASKYHSGTSESSIIQ